MALSWFRRDFRGYGTCLRVRGRNHVLVWDDCGAWRLVGFQDEENEAQDVGLAEVGEQLAGGIQGGERFVDGCYPEAGCGEGADHRRQRPVPEAHRDAAAAEGPFFGA